MNLETRRNTTTALAALIVAFSAATSALAVAQASITAETKVRHIGSTANVDENSGNEQRGAYRYAWGYTVEQAWYYARILESWGYRVVSNAYWGRVPESPSGWAYRIDVIWPGAPSED